MCESIKSGFKIRGHADARQLCKIRSSVTIPGDAANHLHSTKRDRCNLWWTEISKKRKKCECNLGNSN